MAAASTIVMLNTIAMTMLPSEESSTNAFVANVDEYKELASGPRYVARTTSETDSAKIPLVNASFSTLSIPMRTSDTDECVVVINSLLLNTIQSLAADDVAVHFFAVDRHRNRANRSVMGTQKLLPNKNHAHTYLLL